MRFAITDIELSDTEPDEHLQRILGLLQAMSNLAAHPSLLSDLGGSAMAALVSIALAADKDGRTVQSYAEMEVRTGYTRKTLIKGIKTLVDLGLVTQEKRQYETTVRHLQLLSPNEPRPEANYTGTVLYFVQAEGSGLIKIGKSRSVESRLSVLQTSSPVQLHVIGIMRGPNIDFSEQEIHERFADYRKQGEWFEPAPELLQYIEEHAEKMNL